MKKDIYRHGFVIVIGPESNPNYFTGAGYSCFINDAKVFRTPHGGKCASRIWQTADYGRPIPEDWFVERKAVPVSLQVVQP